MFAALGLIVGSFLGMLTYRLPRNLGFLGRSFCDNCKKQIRWLENIPLFSYFVLGGLCRNCKRKISWRYPLLETTTSAIFVLSFYFWRQEQNSFIFFLNRYLSYFSLWAFLILAALAIALLFIDLEKMILPDTLVTLFGAVSLAVLFFYPSPTLFQNLFWGAVISCFFLLIYLFSGGRGMGFGDIKLAFVVGLLFGYPESLVWLFLAFFLGAGVGILLLLLKKAKFGQQVPFGPYLLVSFFITAFWADSILGWYINRI